MHRSPWPIATRYYTYIVFNKRRSYCGPVLQVNVRLPAACAANVAANVAANINVAAACS